MAEPKFVAVKSKDVMKNITCNIKITGLRKCYIRMYLGTLLLKLAEWVLPFKVEEVKEEEVNE